MKRLYLRLKNLTFARVMYKVRAVLEEIKARLLSFTVRRINTGIYEELDSYISQIQDSNGSAYYPQANLTIGIITDEYMYNYYKDAARLIAIRPDNYAAVIDEEKPAMILFISCWQGMHNGEWRGEVIQQTVVPQIFSYAKERGIKTVFQTIEDPPNYERFLPIAQAADVIFTSCEEKIEDYKRDTDNEKVYLLNYGINPLIHNPIGINEKYEIGNKDLHQMAFFAGSWASRYKNRCADTRMIFDGVLENQSGLMIADRNSEIRGYQFPIQYQPYVVPAIEHLTLQKAHKLFDYSININSVQNSTTMCAMRVYELQALGCLMLTNYALSISKNFPQLFMILDKSEVKTILNGYDRTQRYRMQIENLRYVMSECTVFDRFNEIFEKAGIEYKFKPKTIAVLCRSKTERIREQFEKQDYVDKILLEESELQTTHWDYLTFFNEEEAYGQNVLTDLANGFKYTDVAYITKDPEISGKEYDYVEGEARLAYTLVQKNALTPEAVLQKCITAKGFKLDAFGINDRQNRTSEKKEVAVIIPIYNNGRYLYGRCLNSLLRSSIFGKMQLYLIDDGSTDEETIKVIHRIAAQYDNVTTCFFNDGGSGSASRPRNKGVEISTEPYITYLDPDNEALNDGYARLYEKIKSEACDFAFGAVLAMRDKPRKIGYLFNNTRIEKPREVLLKEKMRPQSIQACLIKRTLTEQNDIISPDGALGQDSLYFQELMLTAGSAYYIDLPIHAYYAERADSVVNTLNAEFFRKFLLLEQEQAARFKNYGVYEDYIQRRLDYFVVNWYLKKLESVEASEREESLVLLEQILALYGKALIDYTAIYREKGAKNERSFR